MTRFSTHTPTLMILFAACSPQMAGEPLGGMVTQGTLRVGGLMAAVPVVAGALSTATMSGYFVVENTGPSDTLVALSTPLAGSATLHEQTEHGGMSMMMAMPEFVIDSGQRIFFAPGGKHLMLERLVRQVAAGDTLELTLEFRRAGTIRLRGRIVPYDQLQESWASSVGGSRP